MYPTGKEKTILYTVSGQWTKSFDIYEGSHAKGTPIETYDADAQPVTPLTVAPVEQQDPLESHRAWAKVAEGIAVGNMDIVGTEKSKIENEQRALRLEEQSEGRTWERRYFTKKESDGILDTLGPHVHLLPEADKTGGIWRFDPVKAERVKAATAPTPVASAQAPLAS